MLIGIRDSDPRPIYLQIITAVKAQIRAGTLRPGDELPSVRELADNLAVNLHTVHRAYQLLRDQGVIHLRLGQRARVAPLRQGPAAPEIVEAKLTNRLRELITEAYHLGLAPDDFRALVERLLSERLEEP